MCTDTEKYARTSGGDRYAAPMSSLPMPLTDVSSIVQPPPPTSLPNNVTVMTSSREGGERDAVESMRDFMNAMDAPYDEIRARCSAAAGAGAVGLDPDECDSLESDEEDENDDAVEHDHTDDDEATTTQEEEDGRDFASEDGDDGDGEEGTEVSAQESQRNMGCLRAAARHYPMLASLTGLGLVPSSSSSPSASVAASSSTDEEQSSKLTLLSKSQPSSDASTSSTTTSNRRRIHPRKPLHLRPANVSFSELVSVKEISRYTRPDATRCFYTADELQKFRHEYLLAVMSGTADVGGMGSGEGDDVLDVMQELADAVCGCVREAVYAGPKGFCRMLGVPLS